MYSCDRCRYYIHHMNDEFAGAIGQCRINPPVYVFKEWNKFPLVKPSAYCGQWKDKN